MYPNCGRFYTNKDTSRSDKSDLPLDFKLLQSDLYNAILEIFKSIQTDEEILHKILQQFNESMVSVEINEKSNLTGHVECVICMNEENKKYRYSVPHKSIGNKVYWYTNNLRKHLSDMHNMQTKSEDSKHMNKNKKKSKSKQCKAQTDESEQTSNSNNKTEPLDSEQTVSFTNEKEDMSFDDELQHIDSSNEQTELQLSSHADESEEVIFGDEGDVEIIYDSNSTVKLEI